MHVWFDRLFGFARRPGLSGMTASSVAQRGYENATRVELEAHSPDAIAW